ncbi:hypothetical protein HRbin17_00511 [bacterium HR17]|jgi:hypothetical protein|uniref:Uncharacterized protein n=1 Tax=Candidatus Fervidibacter japonicus TaxID=2035412 RepID=A0A2H5X9Z0_9BACT|nr:hypothetical protein HRbin17_00511 [bacterium HR17]
MMRKRVVWGAVVAAVALAGAALAQEQILKGVGAILLTKAVANQLNRGINAVMGRNGVKAQSTKVVPIVSVGEGVRVGAAQVMGSSWVVQKVEAVAQLEANLMGSARAKILVPVSDINVTRGIKQVTGVGVSAIIDLKL